MFRGLDVGSAKVTPEEADTVRHHLLDVAEVDSEEAFSVASFCDLAQKTIKVLRGGGGGLVRSCMNSPPSLRPKMFAPPGQQLM